MRKFVLAVALALASPSIAQEPQKFVPFTVDQSTYQAVMILLGETPAKYSVPIINILNQKATEAAEAANRKDEKGKPDG